MNRNEEIFLSALSSAINGEEPSLDPALTSDECQSLFYLAKAQEILPLLYETVYRTPCFQALDTDIAKFFQESAITSTIRQITQTNEFLTLILHSQKHGLDPVVLKGIICRSLYHQPYLRPSVDEDLLISPEESELYHRLLVSEGLSADNSDAISDEVFELSYHKKNSPTYIEVHKSLFELDSKAFSDFNRLFDGYMDRTVHVQIEDVSVRTLAPMDHLLYLILHAFKHFVHSGIGIRTVCDIGLFAEHNSSEIDWKHIRRYLEEVHAFEFSKALLRIVQVYLLQNANFFHLIKDWEIEKIDAEPLLEDILASGVHGNSSLERLHSSNITLNTIENDKKTKSDNRTNQATTNTTGFLSMAFRAVFLPLDKMTSRYPYLKKAPFLLPFAWGQRLFGYLMESCSNNKNSASESIRIGQRRVELLRKYGIIR